MNRTTAAMLAGLASQGCATLLGIDGDYRDQAEDAGIESRPGEPEPQPETDVSSEPDGPVTPEGSSPAPSAAGGAGGQGGTPFGGGDPAPEEPEPSPPAPGPSQPASDPEPSPSVSDPEPEPSLPSEPTGVSGGGGSSTQGGAAGSGAGGSPPSTPVGGMGGAAGAPAMPSAELDIASVRSGTVELGSGSATAMVSTFAVDPERSFLVFGTAFDSVSAHETEVTGQISQAGELVFQRNSSSADAPDVPVRYHVAEFESGVRVQRGARLLEQATETVALDRVIDLDKSVPLISFRNAGSVYGLDDFVRAELTSASELSLSMYQAFGVGVVEWQVVTFEDPETEVQSGSATMTSDQTVARVPLATAVDPAQTWVVLSYQVADISERADEVMVRAIAEENEVVLERFGTGATIQATYYVVSFGERARVQNGARAINDGVPDTATTISAVDPNRTVAVAGGSYQRGGATFYSGASNPGYATFLLDIDSGTELVATRGAFGAGAALDWFVIEFQ